MAISKLATHIRISPHKNSPRNHEIDTVTIHVAESQTTVENLGEYFATGKQASSNYGIGNDGRIGAFVDEGDRAWTSGSSANDNRAITIEIASSPRAPYTVNDRVLASLVELLVDICERNQIPKLLWKNDKSLVGQPDKQNMTVHRWFQSTSCPGEFMMGKMGEIAYKVNERLGVQGGPKRTGISYGDKVKLLSGAYYTNGVKVPSKYIGKTYTVDKNEDGRSLLRELYSWVKDYYLAKAEEGSITLKKEIDVGSRVKITEGSVYTNGVSVPASVRKSIHTVQSHTGGRSLLKEINSWVEDKYLILQ